MGVEAYRDMGFLPEAMRNYLLRLGWGHGDEEIIPDVRAIEWFDIKDVGRAPSRFDMDKLLHRPSTASTICANADDHRLAAAILPVHYDKRTKAGNPVKRGRSGASWLRGLHGAQATAPRRIVELAEISRILRLAARPIVLD